MPVDLAVVDDVAERVAAVYREGETTLATHIARRLGQGLGEPDWAVTRLAQINALRRDAAAVAATVAARGDRAINDAVTRAYRSGVADAVGDLAAHFAGGRASTPQVRGGGVRRHDPQAVQALARAAVQELTPLHRAILPQAENAYRKAIAGAAARTVSGAATTREAAQAAWAALVDQGITSFTDRTGRRWRLETYVEMATRTAAHRAAIAGLVDEYATSGVRLVTVPDRPRECRLCRPWEHAVLALWGATGTQHEGRDRVGRPIVVHVAASLDEARAAGLYHPNCRHSLRPWVQGLSRTSEATADPAGEAAQTRQREIERHLRRWRQREATALTGEGAAQARRRVAEWDAEMGRHLKTHPRLVRKVHREHVGAGHTDRQRRRGRAHLPTGRHR